MERLRVLKPENERLCAPERVRQPADQPTAIVVGARGFLGSRIVHALTSAKYRVVGLGRTPNESAPVLEYLAVSLSDDSFRAVLEDLSPTLVVYAAGPASVADSIVDPLADFEGSVHQHARLLDAVRLSSPESQVVTLSSAAVYGNPSRLPIGEGAPLRPISPYGYAKVMCEMLLREYSEVYGLRTCALRVFSAFGPGLRRQLLWDVCEKAASQNPVRLWGTGDETRDFIHVDDVAAAVVAVSRGAEFRGEVYNAGSGVETSVRTVVQGLVSAIAPNRIVEFTGEERAGDPKRWRADVSRLGSLGFETSWTIEDGLAQYAAWYLKTQGDSV